MQQNHWYCILIQLFSISPPPRFSIIHYFHCICYLPLTKNNNTFEKIIYKGATYTVVSQNNSCNRSENKQLLFYNSSMVVSKWALGNEAALHLNVCTLPDRRAWMKIHHSTYSFTEFGCFSYQCWLISWGKNSKSDINIVKTNLICHKSSVKYKFIKITHIIWKQELLQ